MIIRLSTTDHRSHPKTVRREMFETFKLSDRRRRSRLPAYTTNSCDDDDDEDSDDNDDDKMTIRR